MEPSAYNNNTAETNSPSNRPLTSLALRGFWMLDDAGSLVPDSDFGTYAKTGDDPLRVTYTFHEGAVWSDGEPIDCDDFLLVWAGNSGWYTTGEQDEAGNEVPVFSAAGTSGYDLMRKPTCGDGDRTVEVTYEKPYADWSAPFGPGAFLPAHVLEERSGVPDLVQAIADDDLGQLVPAGNFYNTGWELEPGVVDADLLLAAGPYRVSSWHAGQSLTLTVNDRWWGEPPGAERFVIRIVADAAQALALRNGEVDVIAPPPQQDMLSDLEELGDDVVRRSGAQHQYEHLTFNFRGAFADRRLREAFALCVPRQLIVDNLVRPISPQAQVQQSRYLMPSQPGYAALATAVTDGRYDAVDVADARAIVTAVGKEGLPVRLGYPLPNPRRTGTYALVRDSCNQAGFDVRDGGDPEFFGDPLAGGNFDVALFAWVGAALVTDASATFMTGGGNNVGSYSSPVTDRLIRTLEVTTDPDAQLALITEIDRQLWDDMVSIPLYAQPGLVAHDPSLVGVTFRASGGFMGNAHEWRRAP